MKPFLRRRIAVFGLVAIGKSVGEISRILEISQYVVHRDIHHILVAFAVSTKTSAVKEAIARGLIVLHKIGIDIQRTKLEQMFDPLPLRK